MRVITMKVGEQVEDFEYTAYHNGEFVKKMLTDHGKKWKVLFFYPRDFTFVCPTEIRGFAKLEEEFKKEDAVILGCSTDSEHSHKAWFERDLPEVKFEVIADTTHKIANMFNVLEEDGKALRGTFIISPENELKYAVISHHDVGRSIDETLRVLKAFKTGGLCPVEWKPGEANI